MKKVQMTQIDQVCFKQMSFSIVLNTDGPLRQSTVEDTKVPDMHSTHKQKDGNLIEDVS